MTWHPRPWWTLRARLRLRVLLAGRRGNDGLTRSERAESARRYREGPARVPTPDEVDFIWRPPVRQSPVDDPRASAGQGTQMNDPYRGRATRGTHFPDGMDGTPR